MSRILAIDYGTKRTGLAVTDPLRIIATPLDGIMTKDLIDYLKNYVKTETVDAIVVGWPIREDGSDTQNTPHVRGFVRKLEKQFPDIRVVLQDEFNTSKNAVESMVRGGVRKMKRRDKMKVDVTSAVLILQSYMEEQE